MDALDEASRKKAGYLLTENTGGGRGVNMEDRVKEMRGRMRSRRISRKVPPTRYKF